MSNKIRVAILEDHQNTIDGYLFRLKSHPQIEVAGVAMYGNELEPLLAAHPTDVLLLDLNVKVERNNSNPYPVLHVIPRLLERYSALAILVVSMLTERALINAVIEAGVSGYILKDDQVATQGLGAIVLAVAAGGIYYSPEARQQLSKRATGSEPRLTPGQLEALSVCAAYPGRTLGELARQMGITGPTLRNHLSQCYLRMGVSNRTEAILRARELGLITPLPASGIG